MHNTVAPVATPSFTEMADSDGGSTLNDPHVRAWYSDTIAAGTFTLQPSDTTPDTGQFCVASLCNAASGGVSDSATCGHTQSSALCTLTGTGGLDWPANVPDYDHERQQRLNRHDRQLHPGL